jgi:uncharacterized protein (DUF427 family)
MAPSVLDDTDRTVLLERSPRRVRTLLDGELIADSREMRLLHEAGRLPVYGFPHASVREGVLVPHSGEGSSPHAGPFRRFAIRTGRRTVADAAYRYLGDPAGAPGLSELVFFDWPTMDAWFEEDEEVFKHARDPYHRVDTLHSSREVVVSLDGVELARSTRPRLLFETGLPTRYYLPRLDVRADVLRESDTHTVCPYKGVASYHSIEVGGRRYQDLAWTYPAPVPEAPKLQGLIAFFNEKLDITVDGVLEERPRSPWS